VSLGVLLAVVTLPVLGVMSLLETSLVGALGLVAAKVLTPAEARESVQLDVLVMIGASFGLGAAVAGSGLAARLADGLVDLTDGMGELGAVVGLVVLTLILTELVTNAAAAVIAVPIALDVAATTGLDARTLVVAVAVAASCSFLTPIGYQTNTMVYGPGGYRATDYLRLGVPLTLVTVLTVSLVTTALG
jgi:di/tricarboxylate transporter